jgi:hypothetical protein
MKNKGVEPSVETKINKILQDYLSEIINACRGNKINPSKKAVKAIESLLIGEDKCRNCGATEYREEVKRQVQAQMRDKIENLPVLHGEYCGGTEPEMVDLADVLAIIKEQK